VKHVLVFSVFFIVFALASILIGTPLFPGSLFIAFFYGNPFLAQYHVYVAALINGLIYSLFVGLFFVWLSRKLVED